MKVPQHPCIPVLTTGGAAEAVDTLLLRNRTDLHSPPGELDPRRVELLCSNRLPSWMKPPALPGATPRQGREARYGP